MDSLNYLTEKLDKVSGFKYLEKFTDDDIQFLTLTEIKILNLFFNNLGTCISQDKIMKKIWVNTKISKSSIRSSISRLRKKIKKTGITINSVYAKGYVLRKID